LCLALLIGGSFCLGLCLVLGSLLRLLALYLGVFGGIPRVEDLRWPCVSSGYKIRLVVVVAGRKTYIAVLGLLIVKLAAGGANDRRVGGGAGGLILFICKNCVSDILWL
jgi:hypothetical protein